MEAVNNQKQIADLDLLSQSLPIHVESMAATVFLLSEFKEQAQEVCI